ncbi:hypothetical protein HY634_04455 [Candidatus Uhrbacteria bacterium]|nr:hypothetical protein [Candidatus Uhrbacteria bacterium]
MISLFNGQPLAPKPYAYVLAANGLFLAKENSVFSAVVKVEPEELGLLPLEERIELRAQIRIPFIWVYRAVVFFREVFRRYQAEAFLWIRMRRDTGEITLECPKQANFSGHVHAEPPDDADDVLTIGTCHGHPCDAFHSDGDVEDETHSDGLHVVIGNLNARIPDFSASLVVRGVRKRLEPSAVMEIGFGFDTKWMRQIEVCKP